jgi:hypothetical protein
VRILLESRPQFQAVQGGSDNPSRDGTNPYAFAWSGSDFAKDLQAKCFRGVRIQTKIRRPYILRPRRPSPCPTLPPK